MAQCAHPLSPNTAHTTATKTQTHIPLSPCSPRIGKAQTQSCHPLIPNTSHPARAKTLHMSHTPTPLTTLISSTYHNSKHLYTSSRQHTHTLQTADMDIQHCIHHITNIPHSVLTGDVNAHSTLGHSYTDDHRGQLIADVICNSDLTLPGCHIMLT